MTGLPVRVRSDPACAPKASGSSSFDGATTMRDAMTTTTGSRAATAPFTLMRADSTATTTMTSTVSLRTSPPPRRTSCWPAQAVSPVPSRPSATTNSAAMSDDGRIGEAGEGLLQVEHPGGEQGERHADRDEPGRDAPADEGDDGQRQDDERQRGIRHRADCSRGVDEYSVARTRVAGAPRRCGPD